MDECSRTKGLALERGWFPSRAQEMHWGSQRLSKILDERWEMPLLPAQEEVCVDILPIHVELSLAKRFREQAEKWSRETEHLSSPTQMMAHPSYQAILGMALENKQEVIRLMLLDLMQNRNEWFWALSYLTQDNPIKQSDAGKMDKMVSAWVNWGREHNLI